MSSCCDRICALFAYPFHRYEKLGYEERYDSVTQLSVICDNNEHRFNMFVIGALNEKTTTEIVLYSYGNLECADRIFPDMVSLYNYLNPAGTYANKVRPVVCYDYPGYANHDMTEWMGGTKDALKFAFRNKSSIPEVFSKAKVVVFNHIIQKAPKAKIILWGRSIGSIPVCSLLHGLSPRDRMTKIKFTVIQSGIASLVLAKFPSMHRLSNMFKGGNNLTMAESDKDWGVVVFIYGSNDSVVSTQNPLMLMKALHDGQNIPLVIEGQDHNIQFSVVLKSIENNRETSNLFHSQNVSNPRI